MLKSIFYLFFYFALVGLTNARSHIHLVGSSAVFQFAGTVAEEFARTYRMKTPIVESTGTSSGFKMFCSGVGEGYPDMVLASRQINDIELALCKINSIDAQDIIEFKLGDDAMVIASAKNLDILNFTKNDIFKAISFYVPEDNMSVTKNNYQNWNQVRFDLPDLPIKIYGPLKNSGTFDAVVRMILLNQCIGSEAFKMSYNPEEIKKFCSVVRDDSVYIETGNDENIIVQKILSNKNSFGLISYSFLTRNKNRIMAHKINGVLPNAETIRQYSYPVSRPIYIYLKKPHLKLVSGIKDFLNESFSQEALGKYGYLRSLGLIPMQADEISDIRSKIKNLSS